MPLSFKSLAYFISLTKNGELNITERPYDRKRERTAIETASAGLTLIRSNKAKRTASVEPRPPGRLLIVPAKREMERKPNAIPTPMLRPRANDDKYRVKTSHKKLSIVKQSIGKIFILFSCLKPI